MNAHAGNRRSPGVKAVVATAMLLGTVGAVSFIAVGGPAQAKDPAPAVTVGPTVVTLPPGVTLPPLTVFTAPDLTLITTPVPVVTLPPDAPSTTTSVPASTGATTTTTTDTTDTTAPTGQTTAATGTGQQAPTPVLDLQISAAEVTCDGAIELSYDTTANPDTGIPAGHLVVFSPLSDPTALEAREFTQRPANGAFMFAEPGTVGETYRIFLIAMFDPANVAGPKLIAQADALPTSAC
jgi:hypothetical protein